MASTPYPAIDQSPKTIWNPINQQINVIGPNGILYVADDGRNPNILHYDVQLKHNLVDDATLSLVEDHYYDNKLLRFLLVDKRSGLTYNCIYKSPPDRMKDENEYWNITSYMIASLTFLT